MKINRHLFLSSLIVVVVFGLSNSGLHPTSSSGGYTGSPVDSACNQCHSGGGSLDGNIVISGLPSTIETDQTYTLEITISNPNGNAARAGFQLVALNGSNANAGNMTNLSVNTQLRNAAGRVYWGHSPAQNFPVSDTLTFTIDWTAPSSVGSIPQIKFYASSVIANGNGSTTGDRVVFAETIVPIRVPNDPLTVNIVDSTNPLCFGESNGFATAAASGGSGPYSYSWSNGLSGSNNNSLSSGINEVTVTDSQNNTASTAFELFDPPQLVLVTTGSTICNSGDNGTATALASGGIGGYNYTWSHGATGSHITNLIIGTYTVTATDSYNCQIVGEVEVASSTIPEFEKVFFNPTCYNSNNGIAQLNISEGFLPFTFLWSNGSTNSQINSLSSGTYSVTATDAANCEYFEEFILTNPDSISLLTDNTNITCHGDNDGSITAVASGGSLPYTFMWSNGSEGQSSPATITALTAGFYTVTVTDMWDCSTIQAIEIIQPEAILANDSIESISCYGYRDGRITLNPLNIQGTPEYQWSNGATSSFIDSLPKGSYFVTLTDRPTGCQATFDFIIEEPDTLNISVLAFANPLCEGGEEGYITLEPLGGTQPLDFLWSNDSISQNISGLAAGVYSVTVTDQKGCTDSLSHTLSDPEGITFNILQNTPASCEIAENGRLIIEAQSIHNPVNYQWNNGSHSDTLFNINYGLYIVTITDSIGCSRIDSVFVDTLPPFIIELEEQTNNICFGDSLGHATLKSADNLSFRWSTGQIGKSIQNLSAGEYMAIGTDSLGCQSSNLTIVISEPPKIIANIIDSKTLLCANDSSGFIVLTLSGGTGDLTPLWNNNVSDTSLFNLPIGIYSLNITDENNCQTAYDFPIALAQPIEVDSITTENVLCHGDTTGTIIISYSGGYGSLKLLWSDTTLLNDTLINLPKGVYPFTLTDDLQCAINDTVTIFGPDPLSVSILIADESQAGKKDGAVDLTPMGGMAPYSILWTDQDTSFNRTDMPPGFYEFIIIDANNCTYQGSAEVNGGRCGLRVQFNVVPATCFDSNDGAIELNIQGNLGSYDIKLLKNNRAIESPLDSLGIGIYTMIIEDSVGCVSFWTNIEIISLSPIISINEVQTQDASEIDKNDGRLKVFASGGTGILTYEWYQNGVLKGTGDELNAILPGEYTLTIRDELGCEKTVENIIVGIATKTENLSKIRVTLSPNPAASYFSINYSEDLKLYHLEILDSNGQILFKNQTAKISSFYLLDTVGIKKSGVYYIKLITENQDVLIKTLVAYVE